MDTDVGYVTGCAHYPMDDDGRKRAAWYYNKNSKAYPAQPGTGPEGETCGSCEHHHVRVFANRYHKCILMRDHWTAGDASDIRVRSPACLEWRPAGIKQDT